MTVNYCNMKFTKDRQPDPEDRTGRGLGQKTLMLAAIEEETGGDEKEFLKKVIRICLGNTEQGQPPIPMLLSEAMKRIQPPLKPAGEKVKLNIPSKSTPLEKCEIVLAHVVDATISPDQGQMLIGMIKDTLQIQESTELIQRLEAIEAALKGQK
jgi:hypothetical protein